MPFTRLQKTFPPLVNHPTKQDSSSENSMAAKNKKAEQLNLAEARPIASRLDVNNFRRTPQPGAHGQQLTQDEPSVKKSWSSFSEAPRFLR
eukprot:scaffold103334_cov48-Attheya_sp.AAC.2